MRSPAAFQFAVSESIRVRIPSPPLQHNIDFHQIRRECFTGGLFCNVRKDKDNNDSIDVIP